MAVKNQALGYGMAAKYYTQKPKKAISYFNHL